MSARLTAALVVVLAALSVLGALYWKGRHDGASRERRTTERAMAQAATARLEVQGERESARRVEAVVRQKEAAGQVLAAVKSQALKSEDADAPLDPERAARLHSADRELCLANGLAGCPATGDAG